MESSLTCYHCPSADIVGFCNVGGKTPDRRPACQEHVDPTFPAKGGIAALTNAQKAVLESADGRVGIPEGHGTLTLRALERRGFAKQEGSVWRLTPTGHFLSLLLHREFLDKTFRVKSTLALQECLQDLRGESRAAVMRELETRGWRWEPDQTAWVRTHVATWTVVEGVAGIYSYHLRDSSASHHEGRSAACGAHVMSTKVPLTAWGIKGHMPSRWCATCAARAELVPREDTETAK